jgi:four helix bundle protein
MPLPHESLVAWQRADELFLRIHKISKAFPADERYALTSQVRRAAYSVPANIVEGFGRYGDRDRAHFLEVALSSLAEVAYCVHASRRLEYIDEQTKQELETELRLVSAPLRGLMKRYLTRKK